MPIESRARYANGKLEPPNLSEGCEVTVTVSEQEPEPDYPSYVNWTLDEQATWPATELEGSPTDLARNKKHYLYGHPKDED